MPRPLPIALAALAGCAPTAPSGSDPASWPERPSVLLVSLDTLRLDRIGAYGHDRPTTPALDAFAAESLRFDQAFTHHPWTLTAHATMLTGLLPRVHGVLEDRALVDEVVTVAEVFAAADFATLAVVDACTWMDPVFGHDQGFGSYQVLKTDAGPKIDALFTKLDSLDGQPFLAFAHLFDAHSDETRLPYDSAPQHREAFAGWYEGPFDGTHPDWGHSSQLLLRMNAEGEELTGDERRYLEDLYDAGVRTLDDHLARLFDGLEERGLLDTTVVVVVSDHGEELYDHGLALHDQSFDETLRVPLLIRTPTGQRGVTDELAGLVDLAPTILSLAGLAAPADMHGVDLSPLLAGEPLPEPRDYVLIDNSLWLGLRSRTTAGFHGPGGFALFDLTADPEQRVNLIDTEEGAALQAATVDFLRQRTQELAPLRERYRPTPGSVELDASQHGDLAAIGYAD